MIINQRLQYAVVPTLTRRWGAAPNNKRCFPSAQPDHNVCILVLEHEVCDTFGPYIWLNTSLN